MVTTATYLQMSGYRSQDQKMQKRWDVHVFVVKSIKHLLVCGHLQFGNFMRAKRDTTVATECTNQPTTQENHRRGLSILPFVVSIQTRELSLQYTLPQRHGEMIWHLVDHLLNVLQSFTVSTQFRTGH
mmetsp:Transcript_9381/g.17950  ORF Transcript_9381/g.17950 Transcript_9381/m.17950 type:complete len:128 (-) Transcript_9381:1565-1948(-)